MKLAFAGLLVLVISVAVIAGAAGHVLSYQHSETYSDVPQMVRPGVFLSTPINLSISTDLTVEISSVTGGNIGADGFLVSETNLSRFNFSQPGIASTLPYSKNKDTYFFANLTGSYRLIVLSNVSPSVTYLEEASGGGLNTAILLGGLGLMGLIIGSALIVLDVVKPRMRPKTAGPQAGGSTRSCSLRVGRLNRV